MFAARLSIGAMWLVVGGGIVLAALLVLAMQRDRANDPAPRDTAPAPAATSRRDPTP